MWKPIILDVECIVCNKSLQKINHHPQNNCGKMGKIIKMNNNRRLRTPNWSFDEKQFLLELIKQRKDVVVTKSNNGPNHYEEKDIAWNEILHELSSRFGDKFSGSSTKKVKTQWQNMKRIAREEIALNGPMLQNYSRLSLEVCNIIELIKDGVLTSENENLNETSTSMTTNIEIKSEYVEDEVNQPSCSGVNISSASMDVDTLQNKTNSTNQSSTQIESSTSSVSEQVSDANEDDIPEEDNSENKCNNKVNASVMTDRGMEEANNITNLLQRDLQNYFQYSAAEKQFKMDSLKEERQIIRAMRETAELNKIIAEQKLKHVLWVKKQEMLMYSGEPGSGAGKGGGGGGAIREAGGAFGKMEAAKEDAYFYQQQKQQIENMKKHLHDEIDHHRDAIKRHEDAINRHKKKMAEIESEK